MPVGNKQKLITEIVGDVLGEKPQPGKKFEWFINKHCKEHFGNDYPIIETIFNNLNGDTICNQNKRTTSSECDAYFGGKYNLIFEFDEYQHYTSDRLKTFQFYPKNLALNFNTDEWISLCNIHNIKADRYRRNKTTVDFNFEGGRTAQRAYLDCFRDLLPINHGLNPTLRINEFEVEGITANTPDTRNKIEKLLKSKLA